MLKKHFSLILVLVMIVGLFAGLTVTANAAASSPVNSVKIAGLTLNASYPYYFNGASGAIGTRSTSDSLGAANAVFNANTGTLTLRDINLSIPSTSAEHCIEWAYSSVGAHDLVIVLEGTNTLKTTRSDVSAINGNSAYNNDGPSLTIKGNGALDVNGTSYGIWVSNNISIEGSVVLKATGTKNDGISTKTSYDGTITIQDTARVTAIGGTYGIDAKNCNITGGTVTAIGGTRAYWRAPTFAAGITVAAGDAAASAVGIATSAINAQKYVTTLLANLPTYSITAATAKNGTVSTNVAKANSGATVTVTVAPKKGFSLQIIAVTDANGNNYELKKTAENTYSFVMPAVAVEIKAVFAFNIDTVDLKFTDVASDSYYVDAVKWAVYNKVTQGATETTFAPDSGCTRAQVVTFLWRAAGCPEAGNNSFSDVADDSYYNKAVTWAVENGITKGTSETTFGPDTVCTRAQIVTFLYRYDQRDNMSIRENPFTDIPNVTYYYDAVLWAAENGITSGTSATTFSPNNTCTRGQVVTFLYRYLGL